MSELQRLIEMRSEEAERTRGTRDRKEKKRADRERARLQAQCDPFTLHTMLSLLFSWCRVSAVVACLREIVCWHCQYTA